MKIAIIADDLTGACDAGVQLLNYGMDATVVIQNNKKVKTDAAIFNTDSRSLEKNQAYKKVREISREIQKNSIDILYKKIDSTMRGNIGSELNAVYDQFQPDFVFISPAHPNNGRIVRNGIHYLNGVQLSETEVAKDPKTPVNESNIAKLIEQSSGKLVKHIHYKELRKGRRHLLKNLADWKNQGIRYITVDATEEEDLRRILQLLNSEYSYVLCGSAGLINYLPEKYGYKYTPREKKPLANYSPSFFVIGSISKRGRAQLNHLLINTDIIGIEMNAIDIIKGGKSKETELNRMYSELTLAFKEKKSCALYSSDNLEEIKILGQKVGISTIEMSNIISEELGDIAIKMMKVNNIDNLFLTGGDTAQQVFTRLGIESYHLLGELELGVPIGKIDSSHPINVITKAGSFGTDNIMTKALHFFQKKESASIDSK